MWQKKKCPNNEKEICNDKYKSTRDRLRLPPVNLVIQFPLRNYVNFLHISQVPVLYFYPV
jgi:hypothetical protein